MKVSCIVPVYNVETYLPQCLECLQNQTLKELEVIIVNDGSTDSCGDIAKKYVANNINWKYIEKVNGGLSDARNAGLPHVTGEYLAFLDSDDFVDVDYYESMVLAMEDDVDMVVSDIHYFSDDKKVDWIMSGLSDWPTDTISKKGLLSPMFAWNKLVRTSFFLDCNVRYPLKTWYEDLPVSTVLFAKSKKINHVSNVVHYRQRSGSIMSETKNRRIFEIFNVLKLVRDKFLELNIMDDFYEEIEYLHIEHCRLYGMFRFIRSDYRKEATEMAISLMQNVFPNWRNNKYIKNLPMKRQLFLKYYCRNTAWLFKWII